MTLPLSFLYMNCSACYCKKMWFQNVLICSSLILFEIIIRKIYQFTILLFYSKYKLASSAVFFFFFYRKVASNELWAFSIVDSTKLSPKLFRCSYFHSFSIELLIKLFFLMLLATSSSFMKFQFLSLHSWNIFRKNTNCLLVSGMYNLHTTMLHFRFSFFLC